MKVNKKKINRKIKNTWRKELKYLSKLSASKRTHYFKLHMAVSPLYHIHRYKNKNRTAKFLRRKRIIFFNKFITKNILGKKR